MNDTISKYFVEVSKYPTKKSRYITRFSTHNENQARLLYRGINIGNGYKKRLYRLDTYDGLGIIKVYKTLLDRQCS